MKFYDDPQQFLIKAGWPADKKSGGNYIFKRCPFCNDERGKFYISTDKPLYFCHHCEETGNLYQLSKALGLLSDPIVTPIIKKEYVVPTQVGLTHQALYRDEETKDYLKARGFTGDTVKHFGIGVEEGQGKKWLVIPHMIGGKIINCKYRSLPPAEKTFRRWEGAQSILFNCDSIRKDRVVVCEGETDVMSISQGMGLNFPVVTSTTGAGSFAADWIDLLKDVKKVYLCFDRDEAGQKGAKDLARRLGYDRCWNILLPEDCNDVNDLLVQKKETFLEAFNGLIGDACRFDVDGIVSAFQELEAAFTYSARDENSSPWPALNSKLDIEPGHLVCLSADPKVGKTSMSLEWCRHRVNHYEDPVLFYCLEMTPKLLVRKLVQLELNIDREKLAEYIGLHRARATNYFQENAERWFFCGKWFDKPEDYFKLIAEGTRRYGFKWVVFDHFHKIVTSLSNTIQEQANMAARFKRLAEELEITLLLVVQPRKPDKRTATRLSEDMLGSGQIRAEADHIMTLSRKRITSDQGESLFEPETIVRVESRHSGGGATALYFDGPIQKFRTIEWQREEEEVFG